jgi:hypothetical protein
LLLLLSLLLLAMLLLSLLLLSRACMGLRERLRTAHAEGMVSHSG